MTVLYLDISSGISGDMFLGALLDLGVELPRLEHDLARLGLDGYHLLATRQARAGISGVKFEVHLDAAAGHDPGAPAAPGPHHAHEHTHGDGTHHSHPHSHSPGHAEEHRHAHGRPPGPNPTAARDAAAIRELISRSPLSPWVKEKALAVFRRVAEAEGKIHGRKADDVHFHEVGALDSIVDIVGACLALETLGRPRVLAAPVVDGTGWVECAHGRFPVPTPATLEILGARGVSVTQCEEPHELVTPTGAALLAEFAETFAPMHELRPTRIGYGIGSRQNRTRPNVLRAVLGESTGAPGGPTPGWETDTVAVCETNLDDVSPEILGHFMERALAAGALDVFHTPIQMKKSRPGVLLSVLCPPEEADRFSELILRNTSAFGVRRHLAERRKLAREFRTVETPFGAVTVKLGLLDGQVVQAAPEFESCRARAESAAVPLRQVYEAALRGVRL
jgi:pyridinium-3,5-bisthiocarboxylic acid mononucleotide nickel chelatase